MSEAIDIQQLAEKALSLIALLEEGKEVPELKVFLKEVRELVYIEGQQKIFGEAQKEVQGIGESFVDLDKALRSELMNEVNTLYQNAKFLQRPSSLSDIQKSSAETLSSSLQAFGSLSLFTDRIQASFSKMCSDFAHYVLAKQVADQVNSNFTSEKMALLEVEKDGIPMDQLLKFKVQNMNEQLMIPTLDAFLQQKNVKNVSTIRDERAINFKLEMEPLHFKICKALSSSLISLTNLSSLSPGAAQEKLSALKASLNLLLESQSLRSPNLVHSLILAQQRVLMAVKEMVLVFGAILDVDLTKLKEVGQVVEFQSSAEYSRMGDVLAIQSFDEDNQQLLQHKIFQQLFDDEAARRIVKSQSSMMQGLIAMLREMSKETQNLHLSLGLAQAEVNQGMLDQLPVEEIRSNLLLILKSVFPEQNKDATKIEENHLLKLMASLSKDPYYQGTDLKSYKSDVYIIKDIQQYNQVELRGGDELSAKTRMTSLNRQLSYRPCMYVRQESERAQLISDIQQSFQDDQQFCDQKKAELTKIADSLHTVIPKSHNGKESMEKIGQGAESSRSITEKIYFANEVKKQFEQVTFLCKTLAVNFETLKEETGLLAPLMIELMQLETFTPFYMQNLSEIFFLIKLNHPELSNQELGDLLDALERIPAFVEQKGTLKHKIEELQPHFNALTSLINSVMISFKEEEIMVQLQKIRECAYALNASLNQMKAEVSEKVRDLGLHSQTFQKLSNYLLSGQEVKENIPPAANLYHYQEKINNMVTLFMELNEQTLGNFVSYQKKCSKLNQALGNVNSGDYLLFFWARENLKNEEHVFDALRYSNWRQNSLDVLADVIHFGKYYFKTKLKVYPLDLFSRDPDWGITKRHWFSYIRTLDANRRQRSAVYIEDSGRDANFIQRDDKIVLENLVSNDDSFLSEGAAKNYFNWRYFNVDGKEYWFITLEDNDGATATFTDDRIYAAQFKWGRELEPGWAFGWRWFKRENDNKNHRVLTLE